MTQRVNIESVITGERCSITLANGILSSDWAHCDIENGFEFLQLPLVVMTHDHAISLYHTQEGTELSIKFWPNLGDYDLGNSVEKITIDILPPPNLAVMVGKYLRPITTWVAIFRQYTYADKFAVWVNSVFVGFKHGLLGDWTMSII